MKNNEMMSQEEVVKVLDGIKGFVDDTIKFYLKMYGTQLDLENEDQVEALKLFKKGLELYSDLIDITLAEAITVMDTNQKVNQMYEAFIKSGQIEK